MIGDEHYPFKKEDEIKIVVGQDPYGRNSDNKVQLCQKTKDSVELIFSLQGSR